MNVTPTCNSKFVDDDDDIKGSGAPKTTGIVSGMPDVGSKLPPTNSTLEPILLNIPSLYPCLNG